MTRVMFFAYSILTGFTFSLLGWLYDAQSVMFAFAITAVYFRFAVCDRLYDEGNLTR